MWGAGGVRDLSYTQQEVDRLVAKKQQVSQSTKSIKNRILIEMQPETIEEQARLRYGMVHPSEELIPFSAE